MSHSLKHGAQKVAIEGSTGIVISRRISHTSHQVSQATMYEDEQTVSDREFAGVFFLYPNKLVSREMHNHE